MPTPNSIPAEVRKQLENLAAHWANLASIAEGLAAKPPPSAPFSYAPALRGNKQAYEDCARDLKAALSAAMPAQEGNGAEDLLKDAEFCPVTGRKYWGDMKHPTRGMVRLYGGPFDSYMIPERTGKRGDDDEWTVERYDQDAGQWSTDGFL